MESYNCICTHHVCELCQCLLYNCRYTKFESNELSSVIIENSENKKEELDCLFDSLRAALQVYTGAVNINIV